MAGSTLPAQGFRWVCSLAGAGAQVIHRRNANGGRDFHFREQKAGMDMHGDRHRFGGTLQLLSARDGEIQLQTNNDTATAA